MEYKNKKHLEYTDIMNIIYRPVVEDDLDVQEKWQSILNSLIDSIIAIRLINYRENNTFINIDVINEEIRYGFKEINEDEGLSLKYLTKNIYQKIHLLEKEEIISYDVIYKELNKMYNIYIINEFLPDSLITKFFSKILDYFDNNFRRKEKENIINELKRKMKLSKRKYNSLMNSKKIKIIVENFASKNYSALNTSLEELKRDTCDLRGYINSIKDIRDLNYYITSQVFDELERMFLNGKLTYDEVNKIINNDEVSKIIVRKFNKILIDKIPNMDFQKYHLNITLEDKMSLPFNYNNFAIVRNKNYLENAIDIYLREDESKWEEIANYQNIYQDLFKLLPFVNFFPELQSEDFINILNNYNTITNKIFHKSEISFGTFISNLHQYILYVNQNNWKNKYVNYLLPQNVLQQIFTLNRHKYAAFYATMFQKRSSYIPNVYGEYQNYVYESKDYQNPERLLIGKFGNSCIDLLNVSGRPAYRKALLEKDGDVIMIRDKNTNSFVARILMFRKGNFVILGRIFAKNAQVLNDLVNENFLDKISRQIKEEALKNNDYIKYVIMTSMTNQIDQITKYPTIYDPKIPLNFPHADLTELARVITDNKIEDVNLNFSNNYPIEYYKTRSLVSEDIDEDYINKLRVIYCLQEQKDFDFDLFVPFNRQNYQRVIMAEDWYLAIRNNNTIEEVLINSDDKRALEELNNVKNNLNIGKKR